MTADAVLVLGVGTGGARALVYGASGKRLAASERAWRPQVTPAIAPFGREYAPGTVEKALDEVTQEVLARVEPTRVAAIACTGQRIACAFLDEAGEAIYVGPNSDVRAFGGADLTMLDDETLLARTGRLPPWIFAPARLLWFAKCDPESFARIARIVSLPGFAAHRLTGQFAVDATLAADLMMLDVRTRRRMPVADVAPEPCWPPLASPESELGQVHDAAAARYGLRAGTPVAVGLADTQAALLFAGQDVLVAGGSGPLLRTVDRPPDELSGRLWLDPHVRPDRWCLEVNLGMMGTIHRWLRDVLAVPSFEQYDALARQAPLGAAGASAHLGPRPTDLRNMSTNRPAALLMPMGDTSLADPPGRAELARSWLESAAFAVRAGCRWLDEVAPAPEVLHLVGGLSASAFYANILASVLERPVLRGPEDATARGAACCALVVAGLSPDLDSAVARLSRAPARHEPSADYEDAYERWLEREDELEEM